MFSVVRNDNNGTGAWNEKGPERTGRLCASVCESVRARKATFSRDVDAEFTGRAVLEDVRHCSHAVHTGQDRSLAGLFAFGRRQGEFSVVMKDFLQ